MTALSKELKEKSEEVDLIKRDYDRLKEVSNLFELKFIFKLILTLGLNGLHMLQDTFLSLKVFLLSSLFLSFPILDALICPLFEYISMK